MTEPALLEAKRVTRVFQVRGRWPFRNGVQALRGVSMRVPPGSSLGLVGESGSGKSTLVRILLGLDRPSSGTACLDGRARGARTAAEERAAGARVQLVFQDPRSSFNPRRTLGESLDAPLRALTSLDPDARKRRVLELMERVELPPEIAERFPHEVSGGQAQRAAIARALGPDPALIVLDEALSSLDVSIQATMLRLLASLRQELGIGYLLVAHDLAVVEVLCDEIAVMYLGRIVERGPTADVLRAPAHPYTEALLAAVPRLGEGTQAVALSGEPPDPTHPPKGCAFATRCAHRQVRCLEQDPRLEERPGGRSCACFFPRNASRTAPSEPGVRPGRNVRDT